MSGDGRSADSMAHLLNCVECEYNEVVVGRSRQADIRRELHEDSARNWRCDRELCDAGSVAWVFITDERAKQSLVTETDRPSGGDSA